MAKLTRGQKAAKTLGKKHMAEIGSRGGKIAEGQFARNKPLAKIAQRNSVRQRKINRLRRNGREDEAVVLEAQRDAERAEGGNDGNE